MYRLSLFGSVSLSGPSGPLDGRVSQRRPLALLSLLAASEDGLLSRDKLIAYLWPEAESARARHLLSVTLHAIRKALGKESVLSVGDDLRLNPEVVEVDVAAFEAALEEEPARAVELYAGSFLDGFHVEGAPEFERWQQRERTRLGRQYAGALESLAERSEAEGEVRRALELWRKLAGHDPYSSRVALRLMGALERAGDRPGALQVARAHGERVREALGVEPDPEVATLAERLENGEVEREAGPATAAGSPAPGARDEASRSGGDEEPDSRSETAATSSECAAGGRLREAFGSRSGVVLAAVLLFLLVPTLAVLTAGGEEPAYDAKRVLVDRFENRTGDPALEELGRMAADWITQGLTYTGFVEVMTRGKPILAGQATSEEAEGADGGRGLERLARAHGTGTLVWGSFYRQGDSVYFQAHVTDAADRRELASLEPVAAAVEAPVPGLERLRDGVMAALATVTDPRLEKWQRHASKPPTFEAYQTFVEGLELHTTHRRYREAAERFRQAAELDPGFTMARLWETMALGNAGRWDEVDSILRELTKKRERLAPLDRAFLDYQLAYKEWRLEDGDAMGMLRAARRMVEIAPGSEYLKLAGQAALAVDRPAEAARHYERADPESGWLRGWAPYWDRLAHAHHRLGNYERMLEVARRGRSLHPDIPYIREKELRALAGLGRLEELETAVEELERFDGWPTEHASRHKMNALARVGSELSAHGREELAGKLRHKAIGWARQWLAEGASLRSARIALCYLLQGVGDLPGANEQLEPLLAEYPDDVSILYAAVRLRARQGRPEAAMEFLRRVEELRGERAPLLEAEVAARLGEWERALRLLEEIDTPNVFFLRHAAVFRPLRDHPRFQEILRTRG